MYKFHRKNISINIFNISINISNISGDIQDSFIHVLKIMYSLTRQKNGRKMYSEEVNIFHKKMCYYYVIRPVAEYDSSFPPRSPGTLSLCLSIIKCLQYFRIYRKERLINFLRNKIIIHLTVEIMYSTNLAKNCQKKCILEELIFSTKENNFYYYYVMRPQQNMIWPKTKPKSCSVGKWE